ncbi:MAG: Holliday junction branch migration protein RuvA [Ruminococcus sp.]|jgi:Holliday junction DNA helicase RuvA|nr:Holliday junction branch migration protein RuvA [Ruminococcus sp.]
MFYSIKGTVTRKEQLMVVIETGGIGYAVYTTVQSLLTLTEGEQGLLYTHLYLSENDMRLFGFSELNCFKQLISVSGVGPKVAVAILSEIPSSHFALAIGGGDSKMLTRAKGVGPKLAQRIVLELKDKIIKEYGEIIEYANVKTQSSNISDAVSALIVLGYSRTEAERAVKDADSNSDTSEIIKSGLKNLAIR